MEILRVKLGLVVLLVAGGLWSTSRLYKNLSEASRRLDSRAEELFRKAVALDKGIRQREVAPRRRGCITDERGESGRQEPGINARRPPDTLLAFQDTAAIKSKGQEEKDFIIDQIYLLAENPIRITRLDSLYHILLSEARIPVAHAIVYETQQEKNYSCPDSDFYQMAHPLKEYVIGVNREIVLQAYIEFPLGYILKQVGPAYLICLAVWTLCIGAGVSLYREKKRRSGAIAFLAEPSPYLARVTDHLWFDEVNGVVIYKDQRIELVNYRRRLFAVLFQHRGKYLSSDQLREAIWEDRLSGKDALAQTVKRLRDDLAGIPLLSIENVRGKGYSLKVKSTAAGH